MIKIKQLDPQIFIEVPSPTSVPVPRPEVSQPLSIEETPIVPTEPEILHSEDSHSLVEPAILPPPPSIPQSDIDELIKPKKGRRTRTNFDTQSLAPVTSPTEVLPPETPPSPVITGNLGPIYTPMQQRFNATVNPNPVENVSHPGWMQGTTGHGRVAYRRGTYRKNSYKGPSHHEPNGKFAVGRSKTAGRGRIPHRRETYRKKLLKKRNIRKTLKK